MDRNNYLHCNHLVRVHYKLVQKPVLCKAVKFCAIYIVTGE